MDFTAENPFAGQKGKRIPEKGTGSLNRLLYGSL